MNQLSTPLYDVARQLLVQIGGMNDYVRKPVTMQSTDRVPECMQHFQRLLRVTMRDWRLSSGSGDLPA